MKTAKEQAIGLRELLGNGLRYDPVLTSGKSLIETFIEEVRLDAWRQGMTDAAKIVEKWAYAESCDAANEIISARNNLKTNL